MRRNRNWEGKDDKSMCPTGIVSSGVVHGTRRACVVPNFGCVCVTFFHNVNQLFTDGTGAMETWAVRDERAAQNAELEQANWQIFGFHFFLSSSSTKATCFG